MASSRRSSPADPVVAAVGAALDRHVGNGSHVAVALSGGRDSVALLDAVAEQAAARAMRVTALHVHHGLSPHADAWLRFCADLCAARDIAFLARRVDVERGPRKSVEAEARRARYAALEQAGVTLAVDAIVLAHHQDDQAETVLLQLVRGAGPAGLAAMPQARVDAQGLLWLRPLLDVTRESIEVYVRERGLQWIDDDSNTDARYARNALRMRVTPALASLASGYPATVARAATLQAEAMTLADDLAALDCRDAFDGERLDRAVLCALPAHRGRNALRWFLRERGLPPPSAARLAAMYAQLSTARPDARIRLSHAGVEIGVHRGEVIVHREPPAPFERRWRGEASLALAHGTLEFVPARGRGIALAELRSSDVIVRSRRGGERLQLAFDRPPRALKALLHHAAIPPWTRAGLPLLYCGDRLVAVPGIGIDARYSAAIDAEGVDLKWRER